MRVLVTGAAGFIGTHLCQHLRDLGVHVVAIDLDECDILDTLRLRSIIARVRPDAIYHLAAMANVAESWERPLDAWQTNVVGTASVLEAARVEAPGARLLVPSSASVCEGNPSDDPIAESRQVAPVSPYSVGKAMVERLARHYVERFGSQVLIARPANIIGPGQRPSYVVPALCRRIMRAHLDGLSQIVVGNADAVRDFVDVREAVVALTGILERGRPGRAYNVCSGTGTSIGAVTRELCAIAGIDLDISVDQRLGRRFDSPRLVGDPTRTRTEIGWSTKIPLTRTLSDIWTATVSRETDRRWELTPQQDGHS